MTTPATTIPVRMGFTPPSAAIADPDHPGLLRAGERTAGPYGRGAIEQHPCPATDLCADGAPTLDLLDLGVDTVDLSPLDDLQQVLAEVAAAGSKIRSARSSRTTFDGAARAAGRADGARVNLSRSRALS
mgnify:CR=1 FL=1